MSVLLFIFVPKILRRKNTPEQLRKAIRESTAQSSGRDSSAPDFSTAFSTHRQMAANQGPPVIQEEAEEAEKLRKRNQELEEKLVEMENQNNGEGENLRQRNQELEERLNEMQALLEKREAEAVVE